MTKHLSNTKVILDKKKVQDRVEFKLAKAQVT